MRVSVSLAVAFAGLLALAGCGGGDDGSAREPSPPATHATTMAAERRAVRVYLLRDGKVSPTRRMVAATSAPGRAALEQLLAGPTEAEAREGLRTEIPPETEVRALAIEGGVAATELSAPLDALSEAAQAQIVYTLTQFPTVERVSLDRAGGPVARADFEEQTPQILVESPLPGAHVASPLEARGTANTFEATFQLELLGADGAKLVDTFVTATSGSGTRGTFEAAERFAVDREQRGTLVVYERSAEDGSRLHEVRIPIHLTP